MQRGLPKYIYCSMEDAQFYNNRLRMVEISRILPLITETNHQRRSTQEPHRNGIAGHGKYPVSMASLPMAFFAFRMNKRLAKSRREIKSQNTLLEELNQKLLNTNKRQGDLYAICLWTSVPYISRNWMIIANW